MKKFKVSCVLFVLQLSMPVTTFAATNLGDLNYWYSDVSRISRFDTSRKVYMTTIGSGFSLSSLKSYVNHAGTEWDNAGISSSTVSNEQNAREIQ